MRVILFYLVFLVGSCSVAFSQTTNNNCASAAPFCTGQTMNFPASTNAGAAQAGPAYGCLGSQPNPAWFFFQIATGGSVSIAMSANNDIDFICWGPFANLASACGNLTAGNIQSCSYSSSATETCNIANAIPGMFYMMLITNFSNSVQNITFNQSNANTPGAASTNCGFVCVVSATNSGIICGGSSATLSMGAQTSSAVTSYTWFGPNSFNSSAPAVILNGLQSTGVYTLIGTAASTINNTPYSGTCQSTTTVNVVPYPSFSINPTFTSICQGGTVYANVVFSSPVTISNYFFNWAAGNTAVLYSPQSPGTAIVPFLLPVTTTLATMYYSVTITPTLLNCPTAHSLQVIINNPLTPSLSMPAPLCDNMQPIQLSASPGGGTWSANSAVTQNGLFTPALATTWSNTVNYAVSVGTCVVSNTGTLEVSKFHTAALTGNISRCVQDAPYYLKNLVQDTTTGNWSGTQVNNNNYFTSAGLATGNYSLTYFSPSFPNPTVCPSSTVLVVPVFNPPVPVISPIVPRCTTSGTVQLSATPIGGTWSGNPGVTFAGVQNPLTNFNGVNTVSYTAGQGTCVATSSKTFEVSLFVSAAITGSISPLCANGNPVSLTSIVQNAGGIWSGINTNSVQFNPGSLPTGLYTLTYSTLSTPNPLICPDSKTLVVSVLNPPTPVIKQIGPVCNADAPIQLTVTPATGNWVVTGYLQSNGVFTPSMSPPGSNAVQYIIGTSTCNVKQTMFISTEAFVPATIIQKMPDQCSNSPITNLVPFTANTLGTWFGPGISGQNFNPGNSGSGSINLVYKTSSIPGNLCPDADSLSVNVFSLDIPLITQAGPFCNNAQPFQLQVAPLGGLFGGAHPGAISNSGIFSPAQAVFGNNVVSYSISSGPCIAYAQSTISIEKFISAQLGKTPSPAVCVNQDPFNLNSFVLELGGVWSGPGLVGPSMFDPTKANVGASNVLYYHTNSPGNALLCPDVSSLQIIVKPIPKASIVTGSLSGCNPLTVNFKSPENKTGKGLWIFGDGADRTEGFSATHSYTNSGSYDVYYKYEDTEASGCSTMVKMNTPIRVFDNPLADFSMYPEEVFTSAPQVQFTNKSTYLYDNKYQWTVQGMGSQNTVHTDVVFPNAGNYRITLLATNPINGCKTEISKYIEVKNDVNCFIPNSFTPNFDGNNDKFIPVFSPFGLDPSTYQFDIYTRWGQNIFSTTDYKEGWDGTFRNYGEGVLMPDTYNYQLIYRDLEGRAYKRNGIVILLK